MAEKYESKYYRARIGSGKKVHLILKETDKALCGAGKGTKRTEAELVTCGRCVGIRMRMDGIK